LKQKRIEREEKEKKDQLEREKQRRLHGKEMVQVKQKYATVFKILLRFDAVATLGSQD